MDHLEVPYPLAGGGVEGHKTIRKEVVPGPVAAVDHPGGCGQRHVDVPQLLIGGQAAPRPEIARVGARAVAPGVGPELSGTRNDVERPEQLSGTHVEAADVLRGRLTDDSAVAGPAGRARHHHDIADHDRPGRPVELAGERMLPVQVDPALVGEAERRDPPAGFRVQRIQVPAPDQQQPARGPVGPVGSASRAAAGDLLLGGGERRLPPDHVTGARVERLQQSERVRGVQHAVDQDRRRPQIRVDAQVRECRQQFRIRGRTAPDDLQLADVVAIDPVERGVARERFVAAEVAPFALGRLRPGGNRGRKQDDCEDRSGEIAHWNPRAGRRQLVPSDHGLATFQYTPAPP